MNVQLFEGCWGVTRGGKKRGPMAPNQHPGDPWPFKITDDAGKFVCAYSKDGEACSDIYPRDLEPHTDIIAVFATEAEANAYLAGKPAEAVLQGPAAHKPVTWPDGVTEMLMDHDVAVSVCKGFVDTINVDAVSFTPDQARQLAALLLAAADKVEGRG